MKGAVGRTLTNDKIESVSIRVQEGFVCVWFYAWAKNAPYLLLGALGVLCGSTSFFAYFEYFAVGNP